VLAVGAYQYETTEFDGPVRCELFEDTVLRVYGTEFTKAFLRGTHAELELWARPLKTSVVLDLEELDFKLGYDYVEFYLDRFPFKLYGRPRCWATVWLRF
jgi:hypothetical protein